MKLGIQQVHVGQAIDKRRIELGLSKSEFGRKIGVPQQHVNRILERETMETARLVKVCEALDFNFFALFSPMQNQISAYLAAVTLDGDAHNNRRSRSCCSTDEGAIHGRIAKRDHQASQRTDREFERTDKPS